MVQCSYINVFKLNKYTLSKTKRFMIILLSKDKMMNAYTFFNKTQEMCWNDLKDSEWGLSLGNGNMSATDKRKDFSLSHT